MSNENTIIGIVGNPNCGKTTLFNGLTGGKQKIGNWPGVTVEKKEGKFRSNNLDVNLVDLPGIYSLAAHSEDEKVARDYILSGEPNCILNIVDATNLERNLYLTTQLIEMKIPVILVINRMDIAEKSKIIIDIDMLSRQLDCPVIGVSAIKKKDIAQLKEEVGHFVNKMKKSKANVEYPNEIEDAVKKWETSLDNISKEIGSNARWTALKILEEDAWVTEKVISSNTINSDEIKQELTTIEKVLDETADIVIADYRYGFIHGLVKNVVTRKQDMQKMSDKIDKFVLNRVLGIPIFLAIMYMVFWVTMVIGGAFIDFFDIAFGAIFVDGFGVLLSSLGSPDWLVTILAGGVGAGIQTVATFIPIIFAMFFMLSLLEDSGYMARAAFVMDRFMRMIGLPGKSFVPMIVGFGCTVPAVMATRTLETKKDRMLTIFMSPFMSCGARLPVYVLFAAAFFSNNSGLMVFSLYMIGIILAILTGLLLKNTLFRGEASHFVMELPVYNPPRLKHILIHSWNRLKLFILKAGKVIIIVVAILAFLNSMGTDGTFGNEDNEKSVLSKIGKGITPIFAPMGIEEKNWPATVGIFTGIFAKEAVVGTLNSLYSQIDSSKLSEEKVDEEEKPFSLSDGLGQAFATIPENLGGVFDGFTDPLGTAILDDTKDKNKISEELELDQGAFTSIKSYFSKGSAQAYAYLLFILIYFPCVAALGAIVREVGRLLAFIQVTYLTILGWIVSTLVYQITVGHSILWILVALAMLGAIVLGFIMLKKTSYFKSMEPEELKNAA